MAGCRAVGIVLAVAVAALVATAAADDDHVYHWKCFKSCTNKCYDEGAPDGGDHNVTGGGVSGRCKTGCLHECFEDLPALCYEQCVVTTCLCFPPFSKEKVSCLKKCCEKCFHHGPPAPGPGPKPPKPGPGPAPPKPPGPKPPGPKPPGPKPPGPKPPGPKPPMPRPPTPKPPSPKAPPPPKKPCPPAGETVNANN